MVQPGLADAWTADSSGRVWTFRLRPSARLPDGSPVTAQAVLAGWEGRAGSVAALIDTAVVLDDRRLTVSVPGIRDSAPRLFAEPALAMMEKLAPRSGQPGTITLPSREGEPLVAFQYAPDGDPRDALDRGVDLVVARDPAVVQYVTGRPQFATFPLPWSRTYVLLHSPGAELIGEVVGLDSVRRSLARDVVQAEARPAEAPFWWSGPTSCRPDLAMKAVRVPRSPRIAYLRDDQVAKGLAARIVALAKDPGLRAAGLGEAEFARGVQEGRDRGYIVALPREVAAPCHHSAALRAGGWIEPLIDTRATAIIRRGAPPLTVDREGTVRVLRNEAYGEVLP
jgi:extracellular solute-binding protein (family 5)